MSLTMWPNGPIRHGDARCKWFRLLKKTWKLHSLYVVVEIQRVSPRCVRYRLVSWCYGTLVPRQLQRTTWLTSTGYCRSKHTHAHTDFSGTSLHWSLTQFTPASMEVGDLRYANFPGIRFTEVSGKFLLLAASVETCFFFLGVFWKTKQRLLNTKNGREVGDSGFFFASDVLNCDTMNFFKWSVYLFCLQQTTFCSFIKLILVVVVEEDSEKSTGKKQLLCFVAANMFFVEILEDVYTFWWSTRAEPSVSPSFQTRLFYHQIWRFFSPETQVHPQNVWERYFSILVRAPQEILGRGWWVLVVDGWSEGVHWFPFLGLKNEIGDVFWTLFAALDGFVSWTSRKLYDFPILVRFNEVDVMIIQPKVLIAGLVLFSSFISSITVRGYRAKGGGSSWIR